MRKGRRMRQRGDPIRVHLLFSGSRGRSRGVRCVVYVAAVRVHARMHTYRTSLHAGCATHATPAYVCPHASRAFTHAHTGTRARARARTHTHTHTHRASERRPPLGQTAGALWGLATGVGSGGLMLYLRGRRHVIPCHWPCYAGFIPPCALAWWMSGRMEGDAADGGEEGGVVVRKKSFVASFATALLSGLSLVFYVSPDDGRP